MSHKVRCKVKIVSIRINFGSSIRSGVAAPVKTKSDFLVTSVETNLRR